MLTSKILKISSAVTMAVYLTGCGGIDTDDIASISHALTARADRLVLFPDGSEEQGPSVRKAYQLCDKYYASNPATYRACVNMMLARVNESYNKSYTTSGVTISFYDKDSIPTSSPVYINTTDGYTYIMDVEGIWDETGILCAGTHRWSGYWLLPIGTLLPGIRDCQFASTTEPWAGAPFQGTRAKLVSLTFGNVASDGVLVDPATGRYRAGSSAYTPYPILRDQYQQKWMEYTRFPPKCQTRIGDTCTEWVRDPDYQNMAIWGACPKPFTNYEDCNIILTTKDLSNPINKGYSPVTAVNDYIMFTSRHFVIAKSKRPGTVELSSYFDKTTKRHFLATEEMIRSHPAKSDLINLGSEGWVYPYKLLNVVP